MCNCPTDFTKYLALPINNRIKVNIRLIEDTKFQTKKPDRKSGLKMRTHKKNFYSEEELKHKFNLLLIIFN
jgi:hypothetical protein